MSVADVVAQRRRAGAPDYSVVLGAGGRPGLAYHSGTLLALELHGFSPLTAASITGTSAGAIAAAVLAAGGTVEDLAAYSVGATPRPEFQPVATLIKAADERRPRLDLRPLRRLADLRRAVAAAGHLRRGRLSAAYAAAVPGVVEIVRRFDFLDAADGPTTTRPPWRMVAADERGGRHILTSAIAPLSLAVAASCAIPGVFAPVRLGPLRLVDGAATSSTHADLVLEDRSDIVIVLAPMATGVSGTPADTRLAAEATQLRDAGRTVVTFHPSPSLHRLMGRNPLATGRTAAITAAAFLEACDVLAQLPSRRRNAAAS